MAASKITVGYWAIRGLAQPIRLLLNYAGVDFEDKHYKTGPAPDFDKKEYFAEKAKNPHGLAFPNLPYLIDGDIKLTQTHAIMRYLGRKFGLVGSNETEITRCEMAEQQLCDLRNAFVGFSYTPEPQHSKIKADSTEKFRAYVKQFSDFLGDRKWMAGDKLTYVDFLCYEIFFQLSVFDPALCNGVDNLKAYNARFEALPTIAAYMNSDRFLKWPFNNNMATFGSRSTPCPF